MNRLTRWFSCLTAALIANAAVPGLACAQQFPTGPIRIIVPYAAGGQADITARLIADNLPAQLGQPVVVENRPGANGSIGTALAAKAPADGHTLVLVVSSHVFGRALMPNLPFDPIKDFSPITQTARTAVVLVAAPDLPVKNFAEFLAHARARPDQLAYASAGNGSNVHVFGQWFNQLAGLKMAHVPYKGSAAAHADLFAGRTHIAFDTLPSVQAHVASGRLKLLAVAGSQRLPQYPDVPTIAESGFPDFKVGSWGAVLAPAGTPKPVIDKLHRDIVAVLQSDKVKQRLATAGADVVAGTPEELNTLLVNEAKHYGDLIKSLGITLDL